MSGSRAVSRSSDCTRCPRYGAQSGPSCTSSVRVERHREEEPRSTTELALDPDAPAMHLDQTLNDTEPEPDAAVFSGDRGIDLPELGEDVLDLFLRDTDPDIADPIGEPAIVQAHVDVDTAVARELERVAGQIHQALNDPPAIAASRQDIRQHRRAEHQ